MTWSASKEHNNYENECICNKSWKNPFTNKFECICGAKPSYKALNLVQDPNTSELIGRYRKIINHPKKLPNHPQNKYGYLGERYTLEETEKIQEQICYGPKITIEQKEELKQIIQTYPEAFARTKTDIGIC